MPDEEVSHHFLHPFNLGLVAAPYAVHIYLINNQDDKQCGTEQKSSDLSAQLHMASPDTSCCSVGTAYGH